jgi:hypothetical protein
LGTRAVVYRVARILLRVGGMSARHYDLDELDFGDRRRGSTVGRNPYRDGSDHRRFNKRRRATAGARGGICRRRNKLALGPLSTSG